MSQIAEAIKDPGFFAGRNAMAVATAKVVGHTGTYQDLPIRARSRTSAPAPMGNLNTPQLYSEDMRTFARPHQRS